MLELKIGANVARPNNEQSSSRAMAAGSDDGTESDRRNLSYEELIERAKADRAAMITALFRSVAG